MAKIIKKIVQFLNRRLYNFDYTIIDFKKEEFYLKSLRELELIKRAGIIRAERNGDIVIKWGL